MADLPEVTKKPYNDCPWRRRSLAGWLGPFDAEEWVLLAASEEPIACHQTIEIEGEWDTPNIRQCAGAARYRANTFKSPRDKKVAVGPRDREVFGRGTEFIAHHTKERDHADA